MLIAVGCAASHFAALVRYPDPAANRILKQPRRFQV
jgi:hypothetical protein